MFYKFNDNSMSLELERGKVISKELMGCRLTEEELWSIQRSARTQMQGDIETSTATMTTSTTNSVFTLLLAFASFTVMQRLFAV